MPPSVTEAWTWRRAGVQEAAVPSGQEGQGALGRNLRALWRASGKHAMTQHILGAQVQSLKGEAGCSKAAEAGRVSSESVT